MYNEILGFKSLEGPKQELNIILKLPDTPRAVDSKYIYDA